MCIKHIFLKLKQILSDETQKACDINMGFFTHLHDVYNTIHSVICHSKKSSQVFFSELTFIYEETKKNIACDLIKPCDFYFSKKCISN